MGNQIVKAEGVPRATWLWDTSLIETRPDEVLAFLKENNANQVFLQINRDISMNSYKRFISKSSALGIKIHALDGAPDWVSGKGGAYLNQFMGWVASYQAGAAPEEKFSGIHLDLEPYLYSGWTSNYKATVLAYQTLLLNAKAQSGQLGLPLGADMPFWFDEHTYNNKIGKGNLANWAIQTVDFPTIMAYRDTAPAITEIISNEIRMAQNAGKTLIVGVETGASSEGNSITFHEEGKAYMEGELAAVDGSHVFAIHYLESWMNMKP
ncbi:amidase [Neobacillus sp. YIM B06451]|uniref:amidase n=1 Tax=Neobacillus sp. YIM B06451 TaxID=3070994 RepID=UPI00292CB802|nr:amidase [Neobacillus sp. YIM B06451]